MSVPNEEKPPEKRRRVGPSRVRIFYIVRLVYRFLLFVGALAVYLHTPGHPESRDLTENVPVIRLVWLVFALEILIRFFPCRFESRGCQKIFARNYIPAGKGNPPSGARRRDVLTLVLWLFLHVILGTLHLAGILDTGVMILISLAWAVGDILCILYFCPFQLLLMKNKCCVTCRIFSWDHAMAFAPLLFVPNVYTWSLLAMALVLGIRWEIAFRLHPERFFESTNRYLTCADCQEKICRNRLMTPFPGTGFPPEERRGSVRRR